MLIDTHAHLNFNAYKNDLEEVIKRAQKEGVVCINVGTKYETSKKAVEIAEKYEGVYAAIGMHPIYIKTGLLKIRMDPEEGAFEPLAEEFDKEKYIKLAETSKKIVAIGEIGLDYYYRPKTKIKIEQFKNKQKEVFLKQLDLAKELNLPIVFHCRMAHEDLITILQQRSREGLRGVIHCFTGSPDQAQKYIRMGFYIGLNGIIFKLDLDNIIKEIPLEKILIETDCPYLTPPKAKTERNEPIFVKYVAQRVAELKKINYEKISQSTTENARGLFKISKK